MVVGLITARDGSKGIPNKNMVDLGGKPLLAYSFEVAVDCVQLDRTFLSTDITAAVDLAGDYPEIEVPYIRPKELCTDEASQVAVVEHFLNYLQTEEQLCPNYLVLLQPTCPLRKAFEIDMAIELVKQNHIESLIGVTNVMHHPADYFYRDPVNKNCILPVMRSPEWQQRQDFPEVFFNTGALYICSAEYLRTKHRFFDESSFLYEMSPESMLDIDTEFDLQITRGFIRERCS